MEIQKEHISSQHTLSNLQNTSESVTSMEEELTSRSVSEQLQQAEYSSSEEGKVQIQTHITDPGVYSYIITHVNEPKGEDRKIENAIQQQQPKSEAENKPIQQEKEEEQHPRPKRTLSDIAKPPPHGRNVDEQIKVFDEDLMPLKKEKPQKKPLEIDVPVQQEANLSNENFGASSIDSNRPGNEISPQYEDVKFSFPPTLQKTDFPESGINPLTAKVEDLTEAVNAKEESEKKLKADNDALKAELAELKRNMESSQAEKDSIKAQLDQISNIKKLSVSSGPDTILKPAHSSAQTEDYESATSLKIKNLEQRVKIAEKEKVELASIMEKQRAVLIKAEAELANSAKETHTLGLELEAARQGYESQKKIISSLKTDLNNYKSRMLRLEAEHKELQRGRNTNQQTEDKITRSEQLSAELSKENEAHRAVIIELKDQLHQANTKLDKKKGARMKLKEKVKELKKERDLLKIEILKIKQTYSDKCEGYKDAKSRLQKKLKEKEETITSLQDALGDSKGARNHGLDSQKVHEVDNNDDYIRAKSLENTNKYHLKDLSATLQPGEIRRKLESDVFSIDEQASPKSRLDEKSASRNKDEVNDFISTHKIHDIPEFGDRIKHTPESRLNTSGKMFSAEQYIDERIEQFKSKKAEIDSKISSNEQLAAKLEAKVDPVWKKYQSRAQQDPSRVMKSASLHSDVLFA